MKLEKTVIEKTFYVEHRGKTYCISYINSDGFTAKLLNSENWTIYEEDGEELQIFSLNKERIQKEIIENIKLAKALIEYCINHFYNFKEL